MLTWIRTQDGEHRGRPCYDYNAAGKDGLRRYNITWACDHGGMFGYSAYDAKGESLTPRGGIYWARTLTACKRLCNEIEDKLK